MPEHRPALHGERAAEDGVRGSGKLATANLSLGLAFAISSLLSTGPMLLDAVGVKPGLRLLPPIQQNLVIAFASYWIPALMIYVVLRIARVDRRLRSNRVVQGTILAANCLLIAYVLLRVAASSLQGGGAGFVVAAYSPIFIFPAWILLTIGFITLAVRSIKNRNFGLPVVAQKPANQENEWLALVIALAIPMALGFLLPLDKMFAISSGYARLCASAEIKVFEKVSRAKSIALVPDEFWVMAQGQQVAMQPWAEFLLNQSLLEYVERDATRRSGLIGKSKFERMTTVGDRILRSNPGSNDSTKYSFEPANELAAEYLIRPIPMPVEQGPELGLGGARVEIRRRLDDKLIAYAQYFWSKNEFRACPEAAHNGLFIYQFVVDTLNVRHPEAPK